MGGTNDEVIEEIHELAAEVRDTTEGSDSSGRAEIGIMWTKMYRSVQTQELGVDYLCEFAVDDSLSLNVRLEAINTLLKVATPDFDQSYSIFQTKEHLANRIMTVVNQTDTNDSPGKYIELVDSYGVVQKRSFSTIQKLTKEGYLMASNEDRFDKKAADIRKEAIQALRDLGEYCGGSLLHQTASHLSDLATDERYPQQAIAIDTLQEMVLNVDEPTLSRTALTAYRAQLQGGDRSHSSIPAETYQKLCSYLFNALQEASEQGILQTKRSAQNADLSKNQSSRSNDLKRIKEVGRALGGQWLLRAAAHFKEVGTDETYPPTERREARNRLYELSKTVSPKDSSFGSDPTQSTAVQPATTARRQLDRRMIEAALHSICMITASVASGPLSMASDEKHVFSDTEKKRFETSIQRLGKLGEVVRPASAERIADHLKMLASWTDYPIEHRVDARKQLYELCLSHPDANTVERYLASSSFHYDNQDDKIRELTNLLSVTADRFSDRLVSNLLCNLIKHWGEISTEVRKESTQQVVDTVSNQSYTLELPTEFPYQIRTFNIQNPWNEVVADCEVTSAGNSAVCEHSAGRILLIAPREAITRREIRISHDKYTPTTEDIDLGCERLAHRQVLLSPNTGQLVLDFKSTNNYSPWTQVYLQPESGIRAETVTGISTLATKMGCLHEIDALGAASVTDDSQSGSQPTNDGEATSGEERQQASTILSLELPVGEYTVYAECPTTHVRYDTGLARAVVNDEEEATVSLEFGFHYRHDREIQDRIDTVEVAKSENTAKSDVERFLNTVVDYLLETADEVPSQGKWFFDDSFGPLESTQQLLSLADGILDYVEGDPEEGLATCYFRRDTLRKRLPDCDSRLSGVQLVERSGFPVELSRALGLRECSPKTRLKSAYRHLIAGKSLPGVQSGTISSELAEQLLVASGFAAAMEIIQTDPTGETREWCLDVIRIVGSRHPTVAAAVQPELRELVANYWEPGSLSEPGTVPHAGFVALVSTINVDEQSAVKAVGELADSIIGLSRSLAETIEDPMWDICRLELFHLFEALARWEPGRLTREFKQLGPFLEETDDVEVRRSVARCLATAARRNFYVRDRPEQFSAYFFGPLEDGHETDEEVNYHCLSGLTALTEVQPSAVQERLPDGIEDTITEMLIDGRGAVTAPTPIVLVACSLFCEIAETNPDRISHRLLSAGIDDGTFRRAFTRIIARLSEVAPQQTQEYVPDLRSMLRRALRESDPEEEVQVPFVVAALSTLACSVDSVDFDERLASQYRTLLETGGPLTTYYVSRSYYRIIQTLEEVPQIDETLEALETESRANDGVLGKAARVAYAAVSGRDIRRPMVELQGTSNHLFERGVWLRESIGDVPHRQFIWLTETHLAAVQKVHAEADAPRSELAAELLGDLQEFRTKQLDATATSESDFANWTDFSEAIDCISTQTERLVLGSRNVEQPANDAGQQVQPLTGHIPGQDPLTQFGSERELEELKAAVFDSPAFDRIPDTPSTVQLPEQFEVERTEQFSGGGQATILRGEVIFGGEPVPVTIKRLATTGTRASTDVIIDREAKHWQQVDEHEHIIQIHFIDEGANRIVMEHLDGGDLRSRCGEYTVPQALWVGISLADALRYAHLNGIKHLDVKPKNVVLHQTAGGKWDWPKLGDWGLSQELTSHSSRPEFTRDYAGPELRQTHTPDTDARTDVYQLAATLYHLLGGRAPGHLDDLEKAHPTSLRDLNSDITKTLDEVIKKGLNSNIKHRWATMRAFEIGLLQATFEYIE